MSTTDIRIQYPDGCRDTDTFAARVEEMLGALGINPPSVSDMPSHLIITIATRDLIDVATALRDENLI
jgi:hypothetical protein